MGDTSIVIDIGCYWRDITCQFWQNFVHFIDLLIIFMLNDVLKNVLYMIFVNLSRYKMFL